MKQPTAVAVVVAVCLGVGACGAPLGPSPLCRTQPRLYQWADGTIHWEIDTYAPPPGTPCPVRPID